MVFNGIILMVIKKKKIAKGKKKNFHLNKNCFVSYRCEKRDRRVSSFQREMVFLLSLVEMRQTMRRISEEKFELVKNKKNKKSRGRSEEDAGPVSQPNGYRKSDKLEAERSQLWQ